MCTGRRQILSISLGVSNIYSDVRTDRLSITNKVTRMFVSKPLVITRPQATIAEEGPSEYRTSRPRSTARFLLKKIIKNPHHCPEICVLEHRTAFNEGTINHSAKNSSNLLQLLCILCFETTKSNLGGFYPAICIINSILVVHDPPRSCCCQV